jgi:hypothetical protein
LRKKYSNLKNGRRKGMKKSLLFAAVLIGISAIGYSDSKSKSLGTSKLESSLEAIENRFANLMEREEAQRQQYRSEKAKLESEIEELKAAGGKKEKLFKKLQVDSEVRWHRDKYKMLLDEYKKYHKNIGKMIAEKEQKIAELDYLLTLLGD